VPTRVRRGRVARLSGTIAEIVNASGCRAAQSVKIQRSSTRNGSYRTIKTLKSSRTGAFRFTLRPTRTYYYRAQVSQTSACLSAVSSKLRVLVTRR
ncbi:MAG: hypothetical protein ACRDMZ_09735, partial [Solirubrobacteraceae bacterium]